jgi:hypothetical protein
MLPSSNKDYAAYKVLGIIDKMVPPAGQGNRLNQCGIPARPEMRFIGSLTA